MDKITQRLIASSALLAGFTILSPVYKSILAFNPCSQKQTRSVSSPDKGRSMTVYQRDRDTRDLIALHRDNWETRTAISPDGNEVYRLTDRGIKMTNYQTGEQLYFDLPRYFPELSWGVDITYDTKRDLVTLVSLGGEGYMYRFDVRQRRWLDMRSLDNIDLKSISYNLASDTYTAEIKSYSMDESARKFLFISGEGELLLDKF